jgi:hypothetical protein
VKAVILAATTVLAVAAVITLVFRASARARTAGVMVKTYALFLPALVALWATTPPDLAFLPAAWLTGSDWLDLLAAGFFYSAAFFGGVLQLYNLADRGLSLRILLDIEASPGRGASREEIAGRYGGGRGLRGMYDKRIEGLVSQRLVVLDGDRVALTGLGWRWARRLRSVRAFLRLPDL